VVLVRDGMVSVDMGSATVAAASARAVN